jgi:hypothetical protein
MQDWMEGTYLLWKEDHPDWCPVKQPSQHDTLETWSLYIESQASQPPFTCPICDSPISKRPQKNYMIQRMMDIMKVGQLGKDKDAYYQKVFDKIFST